MAPVRPLSASGDSIEGMDVQMEDLGVKAGYKSTDSLTRDLHSRESMKRVDTQMDDFSMKNGHNSTESLAKSPDTRESSREEDIEGRGRQPLEARMEDIALKALHVDDDPTLNPWTFRMFVLGTPILSYTSTDDLLHLL